MPKGYDTNSDGKADYYFAGLKSFTDYGPFGDAFTDRKWASMNYPYSFNGKERDDEGLGGGGSTYDYGFRIYNPNIGRFLSVDPLTANYPWYTPYQYAGNKPIWCIDLDGLEEIRYDQQDILREFGLSIDQIFNSATDGFQNILLSSLQFNTDFKPVLIQQFAEKHNLDISGVPIDRLRLRSYDGGNWRLEYKPDGKTQFIEFTSDVLGVASALSPGKVTGFMAKSGCISIASTSTIFKKMVSITRKMTTPQSGKIDLYKIVDGKIKFNGSENFKSGWYDYVITESGELKLGMGHYTLSGEAKSVKGAGELWMDNGKISAINGNSGHYQPTNEELVEIGKLLKETGLTTDDFAIITR